MLAAALLSRATCKPLFELTITAFFSIIIIKIRRSGESKPRSVLPAATATALA